MATYVMFGKYSSEAIKGISSGRTKKAVDLIKACGGKINSMHVLLGTYDLLCIVDLPALKDAVKVSIDLTKQTGIAFTTSPAVTVEEFDKIAG